MYNQNNDSIFNLSPTLIYSLQLSVLGLVGLDLINIHVFGLRQIVLFAYLTFIPGYLLLKIIKFEKINNLELIAYSIGLSISILIFTGVFLNFFLLFFSYSQPLSTYPLLISISILVTSMNYYCSRKKLISNRANLLPTKIDIFNVLTPRLLTLILFLILTMCFRELWPLFVSIFIIISISVPKIVNPRSYPLIVIIISVLLLMRTSLNFKYLWGCDIHYEYSFFKITSQNNYWDFHTSSGLNSMLSVVMLPLIYSDLMNTDVLWVYKIIYPLLFSLVPLGLYHIYEKQTNKQIALLSVFFFISFFTFYGEMLSLTRQMIGELFFVLLLMIFINESNSKFSKSLLIIIFSFSLVVSHYALSYFYLFYIGIIWLFNIVLKNSPIKYLAAFDYLSKSHIKNKDAISITYLMIIITFVITWYTFIASGSTFTSLILILNRMVETFIDEFFSTSSRDPAVLMAIGVESMQSVSMTITRYAHLVTQFFIIVGSSLIIISKTKFRFYQNYVYLIVVSLFILFLSIVVPYFASSLNMTRIYHIVLIILSPTCIVGGYYIIHILLSTLKLPSNKSRYYLFILSIIIVVYFLSNIGFIGNVVSYYNMEDTTRDSPYLIIHDQDVPSVTWLNNKSSYEPIYADYVSKYTLINMLWDINRVKDYKLIPNYNKGYIFLNYENYMTGNMKIYLSTAGSRNPLYSIKYFENNTNISKIYNNDAIIYINT